MTAAAQGRLLAWAQISLLMALGALLTFATTACGGEAEPAAPVPVPAPAVAPSEPEAAVQPERDPHAATDSATIVAGAATATAAAAPPATLVRPFDTAPVPAVPYRIALFNADGSDARIVWDAAPTDVAWIADPERVAFVQRRAEVSWVVAGDPDTGELAPLLPLSGIGEPVDYRTTTLLPSPDGQHLAALERNYRPPDASTLHLLDLTGAVFSSATVSVEGFVSSIAWSPRSDALLFLAADYGTAEPVSLTLLSASGDLLLQQIVEETEGAYYRAIWSPDGAFALAVPLWGPGPLLRVDPDSRSAAAVPGFPTAADIYSRPRAAAAISPDGRLVAVSWADLSQGDSPQGEWHLAIVSTDALDLRAADRISTVEIEIRDGFPLGWLLGLRWSPDGHLLAFTASEGEASGDSALWLLDVATGVVRVLDRVPWAQGGIYRDAPTWSDDGAFLRVTRAGCYWNCDAPPRGAVLVDVAQGRVLAEQVETAWLPLERDFSIEAPLADFFESTGESKREGLFADLAAPRPVLALEGMTFDLAASRGGDRFAAVVYQGSAPGVVVRYAVRPDGTGQVVVGVEPVALGSSRFGRVTAPGVFPSAEASAAGVWINEIDGPRFLTTIAAQPGSLVRSPDGSAVAFVSLQAGQEGIAVAYVDGSGTYLLVRGGSADLRAWTARGVEYTVYAPGA